MIKELKTLSLVDILPDNLLADEQIYATAKALDKELQLVTEDCKQVMHLSRIDELPESVIDLLAWQWHVDFYEHGMDLATKRTMVKQSIDWHRRKGTPSAVKEAVTAVFGEAHIFEWFNYGGEPYHFKIDLFDAPGMNQEKYDTILRLVAAVKNTRSVLDGFDIKRSVRMSDESSPKFGVTSLLLGCRRINPKPPDNTSLSVGYGFGDFSHGRQVINCGPVDLSNHHPIRLGLARSLNGVIRVECDTSEIPEEFRNILMPSVSGPYIGSGIFGHGYKKVRLQLPDEVVMDIHSGTALVKNGSRRTGLSVPKETEASSRIGTHNIRMGRIRVPADVSEITMGSRRNAHAGIAHAGISQAGL